MFVVWSLFVVAAQGVAHGRGDLIGRRLAAEIGRVQRRIGGHPLDRPHQAGRGGLLAQMLQHHHPRPEGADRVGNALAHDVEGRAMDRLEHRGKLALRIEVRGGGDAERAGERRRQVGEDVGVQIGRDHRVEALRPQGHAHGHGVDQHLVPRDVGKFARDLGRDLVPHHHAVALRVRLGHHGQELARARSGEREGEAHDPRNPRTGEHGDVGRHLLGQAAMGAPAHAGIFAFGVLAHDHPVELRALDVAQRAHDARKNAGGAHIGVLVERLADGEPQSPQRDVVGHVGHAGRAEQDGVMALDQVTAVFGHERAGLLVARRAPVEMIEGEREVAVARGAGVERLDAGSDHFAADAVSGDCRDAVRAHVATRSLPAKLQE